MFVNVLTLGFWTLLSRFLGFARDILIAAALGAGPAADAFFVALRLPNLFRLLFGEGAFTAAFVPAFAGTLAAVGRAAARRLAEEVTSVMVAGLAALTVLGVAFMPFVVKFLAPGFAAMPATAALAVTFSRLTFPYLMLICLTAQLSAVLNGLDRFAVPAITPIVYNLVLIAALFLFTPYVAGPGYALALGVTLGGVAQLAIVGFGLGRAKLALRLHRPRLTAGVKLVFRRMAPGTIAAGATQINLTVDVIIASLLPPGTVSVLYYAERINQLPMGVIGVAFSTALLPLLSRQVHAAEEEAARASLNRAVEAGLLLALPAAAAIAAAARPIIFTLFERGAFGGHDVTRAAAALIADAVGLPGFILIKVFAPGFFARGDTVTPVRIALGCMVLNVVLNLALMHPLQQVGVALATSLASTVNAASLGLVLFRRGHFRPDTRLLVRLPRMALASTLMAGALVIARELAPPALFLAPLGRWLGLCLLVLLGLGVYGLFGQAGGAFDWRELRRGLLPAKG